MKLFIRLLIITVFLLLFVVIIAFARGYRIDFGREGLTSTGIVAVSAFPKASKVYVNGQLKGVSDINLTLPSGDYKIEVKKDGFTNWTKALKLKGELVLTLDVLLYPLNPSLSPMTNLGLSRALSLPQFDKVILFSESGQEAKDGVYIFDSASSPISFFPPLRLILLKETLTQTIGQIELKNATVDISPDAKEGLFTFDTPSGSVTYLLSLENENTNLFDISSSKDTLLEAWTNQREAINKKIFETYPQGIEEVADNSFQAIEFSPDETKVLYRAKNNAVLPIVGIPLIATNQTPEQRNLITDRVYVYDKKEDRNFEIQIPNSQILIPGKIETSISWYSDSKHLAINEGNKISFLDYDGSNKQTVYSGPYDSSFMKTAPDGRVIFLTNLNPETNKYLDLYALGIR